MPGFDVQQEFGPNDVTVEAVELYDKDGDETNTVISVRVRFKNGEIGIKELYPCASEKSLQIARKSLKAMGFDMDKRSTQELRDNAALLKGREVRVIVEEHEYNGKISNRIAWINAIPKAPSKAAISSLDAKLRLVKKDNLQDSL